MRWDEGGYKTSFGWHEHRGREQPFVGGSTQRSSALTDETRHGGDDCINKTALAGSYGKAGAPGPRGREAKRECAPEVRCKSLSLRIVRVQGRRYRRVRRRTEVKWDVKEWAGRPTMILGGDGTYFEAGTCPAGFSQIEWNEGPRCGEVGSDAVTLWDDAGVSGSRAGYRATCRWGYS